jgi:molybdate transport system substrate-binding protein
MNSRWLRTRRAALGALALLLCASAADAQDVRVMISGGLTAAYREVIPEFERMTGKKIATSFGASMGGAPDSIPVRLQRGEPVDVLILTGSALDELVREGKVVAGSRVDLAKSSIGVAVRTGAPKPDISSVEALKRTLIQAKSIAYSASASGTYLSTELFPQLGIADQIKAKSQRIESERVAVVIARGGAELGFQQISELLGVPGTDYVGPLPPGAQRITVYSAGIGSGVKDRAAASALIEFLASPAVASAITKSGLELMH